MWDLIQGEECFEPRGILLTLLRDVFVSTSDRLDRFAHGHQAVA